VEPTRPIRSGGVACWKRACEGTMIPATEKPMTRFPRMVDQTYGSVVRMMRPTAMPQSPPYTCSVREFFAEGVEAVDPEERRRELRDGGMA